MADVIPLAPHRRSQPSEAPAALREPGTILFFTGVRYERQDEPAPAEQPVRRRPRTATPPSAGGTKRQKKATSARQPA